MTTRRTMIAGLLASGVAGDPRLPRRRPIRAGPVRIIVPFAPGGGADIVSRLIAPHMQSALGQSVIVENRAGAAGRIGTGVVAKSDPDGHTLLVSTESSLVIAPHIGQSIGYDPLKDFAPVSLLTRNTVMLVVHPSVPAHDLAGVHGAGKAKPGELFYASSGVGGPNHLAGRDFQPHDRAEDHARAVPGHRTGAQAVISNQVGAMWGFMAGLIPHIRGGALRALAVGSTERSTALPEVPTVAEAACRATRRCPGSGWWRPRHAAPVMDKLWGAVQRGDAGKGRDRQSGRRRLRDRGEQARRNSAQVIEARLRQVRQARPTCSRR